MKTWIKGIICVTVIGSVVAVDAAFPLHVDIDVNAKTSRRQIGSGADGSATMETVQVKVKVRKSGGDLPECKLSAEIYVIGKQIQTGHYGIIDVKKGEFELLKEDDYTAEYKSPIYTLGRTDGNINVGGEYETYLVVISGPDGKVIDYRSGRALNDKKVAFIRTLGKDTMFDRDGNVLGKLENKGEALKIAIPAAVSSGGGGRDGRLR
jgi:hypothetical protein